MGIKRSEIVDAIAVCSTWKLVAEKIGKPYNNVIYHKNIFGLKLKSEMEYLNDNKDLVIELYMDGSTAKNIAAILNDENKKIKPYHVQSAIKKWNVRRDILIPREVRNMPRVEGRDLQFSKPIETSLIVRRSNKHQVVMPVEEYIRLCKK